MNALDRFKEYSVRIPKKAKEELEESLRPEESFTTVDLTDSELAGNINALLAETVETAVSQVADFIGKVSSALEEAGLDTDFLQSIPNLDSVKTHLVDEMDFVGSLKSAIRTAASEAYLASHPEVAACVAKEEKAPASKSAPAISIAI